MSLFTKEQVFLVTGASSGIGQGVALKLNQEGATVVAIARRADKLEETKAQAAAPESFFCEVKDLAEDIADLPKYMKSLKDKYGKLSGLAYCAGIDEIVPLRALDLGDMQKLFAIDYFAPIFMAKGFADKRINNGRGSAAVFISSIARLHCSPGMTTYSGAKAALTASVKVMARELASSGIRFNSISPAIVNTDMTKELPHREEILKKYPFGFAEVEDPANLVCFLLSKKSKWITGQDYVFDCGTY